jgi:hypothetical protein
LNIDFGNKNERQDCAGQVQGRGLVGEGRMNGVDEGERIWLMGLVFT